MGNQPLALRLIDFYLEAIDYESSVKRGRTLPTYETYISAVRAALAASGRQASTFIAS